MHYHIRTHIAAVSIALLCALPISAHAQADASAQIAGLLGQIKALQTQLAQLLGTQGAMKTEVEADDGGVQIVSRLRLGSSGEEVRALQELLAKDAMLYPDGLVTGFFGPKTAEAVKRLQAKYGLEAVGEVGPLTREKIKEWRKSFKRAAKIEISEIKKESSGSGTTGSTSNSSSNSSGNSNSVDSIIDSILGDSSDDVNDDDVTDSIPDGTVNVTE